MPQQRMGYSKPTLYYFVGGFTSNVATNACNFKSIKRLYEYYVETCSRTFDHKPHCRNVAAVLDEPGNNFPHPQPQLIRHGGICTSQKLR